LRALARLPDPRVEPALLDMFENELFAPIWRDIAEALAQLQPSADGVARAQKRFDAPDATARQLALTLLVAWRVDASAVRIAAETVGKGEGFYQVLGNLAAWKHPAVLAKAREILAAPKADADARARAMRLLVSAGQPQDVRLLLQLVRDPRAADDGGRNALPALVSLVLNGNVEALQGLTAILAGNDRVVRQAALRALLEALTRPGPNQPALALPEGILTAVRGCLGASTREAWPDALTILVLYGDADGVNALTANKERPGALAAMDAEQIAALASTVTRARSSYLGPLMLALVKNPKLGEAEQASLLMWLRQWGGVTKPELDALSADIQKSRAAQAEASLGQADDGLALTVTLNVTQIPIDRKGSTETTFPVSVKNTGKVALKLSDEAILRALWRSAADPDRGVGVSEAQLYLGKPKPLVANAPIRPLTMIELAPGKTVAGTVVVHVPTASPGPVPHQVSFQWQWSATVPVDPRTPERGAAHGFYGTRWTELSLIPELWQTVDMRSKLAR
jgi:hypothetical protein